MHLFGNHQRGNAMKQLSELIDTKIVDTNGEPVGAIDELLLNSGTGKIERVIVKTKDHARFSIEWDDLLFRGHQFIMKRAARY